MRPAPVLRAVGGGLAGHRVQAFGIAVVVLVSAAASVLGLALAVDSSAPFDHAFAVQRGADVTASVSSARATQARLAATGRLRQVTAVAGPFGEITITARTAGLSGCHPTPATPCFGAQALAPMTVAGRASPGGPVDDLTLQSGHWATKPGQLVLSSAEVSPNGDLPPDVTLGTRLTVTGVPGTPALTIVGIATSITGSADGWVAPAEIAALQAPGTPPVTQLLYRFRDAGTAAAIRADVAAVTAALPAGAVAATQSYLTVRAQEASGIAPLAPFLVASGLAGLVMSMLIVVNIVGGAVVAGYRRIGILKSIGFTPGQVVAAYTSQAMVPAAVGGVAGLVIGNLLAVPLLGRTASVYGVGTLGVPAWADAAVAAAMCGLTGIAAVTPAVRAGRLSAVQAIAAGRAPRTGRGFAAHRLLGRLPLPRPVTIGLAAPFARPGRTAVTLTAVVIGASVVTLAAGLGGSLGQVVAGLTNSAAEQVRVVSINAVGGPAGGPGGGPAQRGPGPSPAPGPMGAPEQRAIVAALRAQPGTLHYVAEADGQATVEGVSGPVAVTAFSGDASWTGYGMISGHWYSGPGQVDVSAAFLTATGAAVGDTITVTFGVRQVPVRIAGEVFGSGPALITGWQTLAGADPGLAVGQYDVGLRPGTSAAGYAQALGAALGSGYSATVNSNDKGPPVVIGLIAALTLLLAIVAALGVLNTVLLQTRERTHDLGVFKAVGMTPRQAIVMVVAGVAGTGLVAGLIAVPAGIALQRYLVRAIAAAAGSGLPGSFLTVYRSWELAVLALAGVAIAIAGALLPATWAAQTKTASALRTE